MKKSQATRNFILKNAVGAISGAGLGAITIGQLAATCGLSKSGIAGQFGSKEQLQLAVMKFLVARFEREVIVPAMKLRGLEKLRLLVDNWFGWAENPELPRGCPLIAASIVSDSDQGLVQNYLRKMQRMWVDLLARVVCEELGRELKNDCDPEQIAFEIYALYLGYHYFRQVLGDVQARKRAIAGFDRLVETNRSSGSI